MTNKYNLYSLKTLYIWPYFKSYVLQTNILSHVLEGVIVEKKSNFKSMSILLKLLISNHKQECSDVAKLSLTTKSSTETTKIYKYWKARGIQCSVVQI